MSQDHQSLGTYQETQQNESEFSHLYKNMGKLSNLSQQERRENILKEQKEKRHNTVDSHRNFTELFLEDDNDDIEDMEVETKLKPTSSRKFHLMESEWFCQIPSDLEDNWLVKLAPEGFRVLVLAKKHNTIVYNKKGRKLFAFKSHLPGGGLDKTSGLTVLDCIYNKVTKVILVLDCLYWNTMSMLDSETTFRFYWLKNKFNENFQLNETNKAQTFQILDFFPALKPLIQDKIFEVLTIFDQQIIYEGVVFYHKEANYTFEETPLLGWLFTYMLPEKLGIDVPEANTNKMPKDYECLEKYLQDLHKKKNSKIYPKDRASEHGHMEVS